MNKGFTLIEVIIAVSIAAILLSASFVSIGNYKKLSVETDVLASESMTLALINYGKQYCREKEKPGYILFDASRNEISFYSSMQKIDGFKLPKGVYIHSVNTASSKLDINKYGASADSGTIILADSTGELHNITIAVGTGYAEIK